MKETRKIFWLYGENQKEIAKAMQIASCFKAITVLPRYIAEKVNTVFQNNKNVVIPTAIKISENYRKGQFLLHVTDGNQKGLEAENILDTQQDIAMQLKKIAEKYEVDIGDYIPVETENFSDKGSDKCVICNIYNNKDNYDKKMVDIVVYESENFFAVPALGTLLPGYLMICPKAHIMSCAECSNETFEELKRVVKDLSIILEKTFSKRILIFENGSGTEGCGKKHASSIVHAHMHIIPTDFRMKSEDAKRIKMRETTFEQLLEHSRNPYIFVMDQNGKCTISDDTNVYRPRQYIRQLISESEQMPGTLWDWRKHAFTEVTEETLLNIADYLRENFTELSETIIKGTQGFLKEMDLR